MASIMHREEKKVAAEILLCIFSHFMAYNTDKSDALIRLSLVCKRWQAITHHHCKFWLELVGPAIPESFLEKLLPRSLTSSVSLIHRPRKPQFHAILTSHLHHIDCIDLLIPFPLWAGVINSFDSPAPCLREVNLTLTGVNLDTQDAETGNRPLPRTLFNGGAPLLHSITLLGFTVPLFPTVFRGMNVINLGPWSPWFGGQYPVLPLLDALRNAPSLEVIILTDCLETADSNIIPNLTVHLPNLKALELTGVSSDILTLVLALALPPSCKIQLYGRTESDYDNLLTTFMRGISFPAMQSIKLNIELMWGRIRFDLSGEEELWELHVSFPDPSAHLLVIASTFLPMHRISEIALTGGTIHDITGAWFLFLPSWHRVTTLSLSGPSALDILLAVGLLGETWSPLPRLSTLCLIGVDFGMPTGGLNMTLADLVLRFLDQPRRRLVNLIVKASRTSEQVLYSILESIIQDVELDWDGEEDFSETESVVSEGEE